MKSWDIAALGIHERKPRVLDSTGDSRLIALRLGAGEALDEHQVHERTWLMPISGELDITTPADATLIRCQAGTVVELEANERHAIVAREASLLLFLLTPWPGIGHRRSVVRQADDPWGLDPLSPQR